MGPTPDVPCDFSACGGDLLGTWTLADACGLPNLFRDPTDGLCPDIASNTDQVDVVGTAVFRPDQTQALELTIRGVVRVFIPLDCLPVMARCSDIDIAISGSCVQTGQTCLCTSQVDQRTQQEGTWSTSGSQVTTVPEAGAPDTSDYCVDGATFTARNTAGAVLTFEREPVP